MGERSSNLPVSLDLEELFLEHADGLTGAVRGILGPEADVEEVLQEAFLRILKARRRGGRARDPVAWIFVVTMNLAKDLRRSSRRRGDRVNLEEVDPVELKTSDVGPLTRLQGGEWVEAARRAIRRLKETEKEVFLLRTSGGCSFSVIADALGIPVGTAKTRMRAALRRLRESLASYAPEVGSAVRAREDER